jgi:RNA polymerase sigma-70 factor (ECF subfamily)
MQMQGDVLARRPTPPPFAALSNAGEGSPSHGLARSRAMPPLQAPPLQPPAPTSYSRLVAQAPDPAAVTPRPPATPPAAAAVAAEGEVRPADVVLPKMSDESELLSKAATGDTAAFRALYLRHRPDVARLVFRMLGARSDLDDVVQEVFFQVFRSLKDFRGQSKFSTWLHRVTVNVVLMHRRSARSRPVFTEEPSNDITADQETVAPDEDADRRERMRAFGRVLDRLAEKKRIVFVLHELEGVPPTEIATMVGAPVLTVRTRLFYARREIEAMLADEPSLASLKATLGTASEKEGEGDES